VWDQFRNMKTNNKSTRTVVDYAAIVKNVHKTDDFYR